MTGQRIAQGLHLTVAGSATAVALSAPGVPLGWRIFWLTFAAIGGIAELVALAQGKHGTASNVVWWIRGPVGGYRAFAIIAFMAWLVFHFGFGWFS